MESLGQYKLLQRIAIGGMAEIFLAEKPGPAGFSRRLAIKRILPHRADDSEFVEMFLNEARLAAMLNHPNIVQIYDLGEVEDTYYIAMEYVDGYDLGQILDKSEESGQPIPPAYIARIMAQAATGLHYAHNYTDPQTREQLGLVHRDISLPNIMVSRDGIVKLLDFGIAKASAAQNQREATQTGVLKGKISYMSPEYLRGETIDGRHDLFALGVVMYEMATGQKPFQAKGDVQMLQAILTQPPRDPYSFNPSLPARLVEIIMRLLAKNPADRMQTGSEIQTALESFLYETGQQEITQSHLAAYMQEIFGHAAAPNTPAPSNPRLAPPSRASNTYNPPQTPAPRSQSSSGYRPHTPQPTSALAGGTSDLNVFQPIPSRAGGNSQTPNWMVEETKALSLDSVPLDKPITPQHTSALPGVTDFADTIEPQKAWLEHAQPTPTEPPIPEPPKNGEAPSISIGPPVPSSEPPPMADFTASNAELEASSSSWLVWFILLCFLLGGGAAFGLWWYKRRAQKDQENTAPVVTDRQATPQVRVRVRLRPRIRPRVRRLQPPPRTIVRYIKPRTRPRLPANRLQPRAQVRAVVPRRATPPSVDSKAVGLYLSSKPRCVVYWRGQMLGRTPQFLALPPGQHLLMLRRIRPYVRYVVKVDVPAGQFTKKHLNIREGLLVIRSPYTAKLYIDGNYYGQLSQTRSIRLYAGYHKVEARTSDPNARRRVFRRTINLRGGGRFNLRLKF